MALPRALLLPALLLGALFLGGCSYVNVQLNDNRTALENRVKNDTRSAVFADVSPPTTREAGAMLPPDRTVRPSRKSAPAPNDANGFFVGLALSGGGSRSANFAAACMFQLERIGLLQHVNYLSSVSGGSVTAAYYCTSGEAWNPAAAQKLLSQPFASDLVAQSLLPWNMAAYLLSDFDRTDVLADIFQNVLFNRAGKPLTFADLRSDRPRLLINATDLQSGRRFVFCNESFDEINSDLARYPIASAVAASAAVPVVLHPVTLADFSTNFRQYRHLVDGSVADNLGLQTLVETYESQVSSAAAIGRPDPYPNGAVFMIINAQTRYNARLSSLSDVGMLTSLRAAMGLTSRTLVGRVSSATLAEVIVNNAADDEPAKELRAQMRQLDKDGFVRLTDRHGHAIHIVYISLAQLEGMPNLPFFSYAEAVNTIGTNFDISPAEAASLYDAAALLVRDKLEANLREILAEIRAGKSGAAAPQSEPAAR